MSIVQFIRRLPIHSDANSLKAFAWLIAGKRLNASITQLQSIQLSF